MVDKKEPTVELDMSPADTAQELARARARIAELEAAQSAQVSFAITSNTEISAGADEDGEEWWYYKIDLPPIGGTEIKINGEPLYHGTVYKLDLYLLRSIKEIVARAWGHENNIRGSNENAYRQPSNRTLRGGQRVH